MSPPSPLMLGTVPAASQAACSRARSDTVRHAGKHSAAGNKCISSGDLDEFAAWADGDSGRVERDRRGIGISVRQHRGRADHEDEEQAREPFPARRAGPLFRSRGSAGSSVSTAIREA